MHTAVPRCAVMVVEAVVAVLGAISDYELERGKVEVGDGAGYGEAKC